MDTSEEQFPELIANAAARASKIFKTQNSMPPFGLSLTKRNQVEVVVAVDFDDKESLNFIQNELKERVINEKIKACGIVYADYSNHHVVMYLENSENYCLKVEIPVVVDDVPILQLEKAETDDGMIHVFPESYI